VITRLERIRTLNFAEVGLTADGMLWSVFHPLARYVYVEMLAGITRVGMPRGGTWQRAPGIN
jgi:hypothetical protein